MNWVLLDWFFSAITGPFKINGVPLRRVNQSYVIGTSTKVDISTVNVEKFDDKYFAKEGEKKKKKSEGEFFEAEKEVSVAIVQFSFLFASSVLNAICVGILANIDLAFVARFAGEESASTRQEG